MTNLSALLSAGKPVECTLRARVISTPGTFYGTRTHAQHEHFLIEAQGQQLEVVENLALAPYIPAQPGDELLLHGELVPHGSHGPMMHWLHHDPSQHHEDGYCIDNGRRYA